MRRDHLKQLGRLPDADLSAEPGRRGGEADPAPNDRPKPAPRPGRTGPRTPYPVDDPGIADPRRPGSEPDVLPGPPDPGTRF